MSMVTVLMAVYNAEKYLHESLDSLTGQTLHDIQIVCIDDASTDSSLQILNDYAARDSRIRVLHLEENHGQAYARNKGLTIADGEFITMLDADDWLAPDSLQQAVSVFKEHPKTDCVLMDLQYVFGNGDVEGYDWHYPSDKAKPLADGSFEVMSGYDAFITSLDWGIHGVTMDRAELFAKYPYDDTCRFYSDDNTARLHYLVSREVRCCNGKYYYRQVSGSTSHQITIRRMDWMGAAESMRRQLTAMNMGNDVLNIWEWQRWKIIIDCYWFYFSNRKELSCKDRKYCKKQIKKAWESVLISRLKGRPIHKFGWYPFPGHWLLFQTEEWTYFMLRTLMGRR